jgi:uncharacterized protein (TIGR02452 family)
MKGETNMKRNSNPAKWLQFILNNFAEDIEYSVANSDLYMQYADFARTQYPELSICNDVSVEDLDTTSAIFKYSNSKVAALNFANYVNCGGGFMYGANAQEECLCAESTLYPVLYRFSEEYYTKHLNEEGDIDLHNTIILTGGDDMIYSKDITFIRGEDVVKADIITAAAPLFLQHHGASKDKYDYDVYVTILENRIKKILQVSNNYNLDTLILGAFGCGAFGNDPELVSSIFSNLLQTTPISAEKIVFAVPNMDSNYSVFKEIIERR